MAFVYLEIVRLDGNVVDIHPITGIRQASGSLPGDTHRWVQVIDGKPLQSFSEREIIKAEVVDE